MLRLIVSLILALGIPWGCSSPSAVPTGAVRVLDASDGGRGQALITLHTPRRLLNLGPITQDDVGLVLLELFRFEDGIEIARGVLELGPDDWRRPINILHLRANSTYRLRATAYRGVTASPAARISVLDAQRETEWQTSQSEETMAATLSLQLIDSPKVVISTLAGGGQAPLTAGLALTTSLRQPRGAAVATDGTHFVIDQTRLWRISRGGIATPFTGEPTPGDEDGEAGQARFQDLRAIVSHADGTLTVLDQHRVRRISTAGVVSTVAGDTTPGFADGSGQAARFNGPQGLAIAPDNSVFIADTSNHRIRRLNALGQVTTVAGQSDAGLRDGSGAFAQFSSPIGLAFTTGGILVIADSGNFVLRAMNPQFFVNTWIGRGAAGFSDGPAGVAEFIAPRALISNNVDEFFLTDGDRIRAINADGDVSTLAGGPDAGARDGTGADARFDAPSGLALLPDNHLTVADTMNRTLRRVTPAGEVSTWAGTTRGFPDGIGLAAELSHPAGVAVGPEGHVYIAEERGCRIRILYADGRLKTFAGTGIPGFREGNASRAQFIAPRAVAAAANGTLFVSDAHRIRAVSPDGVVSTLAGDEQSGLAGGTAAEARFNTPGGLLWHPNGTLYVADTGNHCIRAISPEGVVTTVAGAGGAGFANGVGTTAYFNHPEALSLSPDGQLIYVSDRLNHRIRVIDAEGNVTTLAGSNTLGNSDGMGALATFQEPVGLAVDPAGVLYVADSQNHRIRRITPWGLTRTLAGSDSGYADGAAEACLFSGPTGLAITPSGALIIADTGNSRIRRLQ